MSSWADDGFALELARTSLAERYPGEVVEIVETFDIAYSSWECDDKGALITRDGAPEIIIVDRVGGDPRPDIEQVREQLAEYRRLIADTEGVLERYERRRQLFENGGRIVLDVADLSETELVKIADSEIPEDMQWRSDGMPPPDMSELKRQLARSIVYAAAKTAGWQSLAAIVKEVTQRQRFREWP